MSKRTPLIAGNWKMNKTSTEGVELVKEIAAAVGTESSVNVLLCPPFTALSAVSSAVEGTHLGLGAQNMHDKVSGAFTGEISASMLRDLYVTHVILGHSERRSIFGENDAFINRKVLAALSASLKPILCVGELLSEREANQTMEVVRRQIEQGLAGVPAAKAENVVIAYEPVWAIGTGKTATPAMAQEVHAFIRKLLAQQFGAESASRILILYGGSMKPDNADALLAEQDIDGGLIGGASLEAKSFVELVQIAAKSLRD
ncbi:MAG: triose-phosphate isomerase [Verrucomicrobia bacterium]|nr:triose-phosphate isomerase [Verrucomicrobiota bacterium]